MNERSVERERKLLFISLPCSLCVLALNVFLCMRLFVIPEYNFFTFIFALDTPLRPTLVRVFRFVHVMFVSIESACMTDWPRVDHDSH